VVSVNTAADSILNENSVFAPALEVAKKAFQSFAVFNAVVVMLKAAEGAEEIQTP
jgi:hypothetical protein